MSRGLGTAGVRENKKPIVPAPTVTAARNGTKLVGTNVELGQTIAGTGAALLHNTEIPLAGFLFQMYQAANGNGIFIDTNTFQAGDFSPVSNGFQLYVDRALQDFGVFNTAGNFLDINKGANIYRMGDLDYVNNGLQLNLKDANANKLAEIKDVNGQRLALDILNGVYKIGDIDGVGQQTYFDINDGLQRGTFFSQESGVARRWLLINAGGDIYGLGDLDKRYTPANRLSLGMDLGFTGILQSRNTVIGEYDEQGIYMFTNGSTTRRAGVFSGGWFGLDMDFANDDFRFGDCHNANAGIFLQVKSGFLGTLDLNVQSAFTGDKYFDLNLTAGTYQIGDIDTSVNGTRYKIDDTTKGHNFSNIQDFANNAAAVAGGLVAGDLFKTVIAGEATLKIVQ